MLQCSQRLEYDRCECHVGDWPVSRHECVYGNDPSSCPIMSALTGMIAVQRPERGFLSWVHIVKGLCGGCPEPTNLPYIWCQFVRFWMCSDRSDQIWWPTSDDRIFLDFLVRTFGGDLVIRAGVALTACLVPITRHYYRPKLTGQIISSLTGFWPVSALGSVMTCSSQTGQPVGQ